MPKTPPDQPNDVAGRQNRHTTDSLRQAIDRGHGADKVNFTDPAAAPLGTDDEASGYPPSPEQIALAARSELRPDHAPESVEQSGRTISDRQSSAIRFLPAVLLVVLLLFGVVVIIRAL
jgi:hypothetical protein